MGVRNVVERVKVGLFRVGWGVERDEGEKGVEGEFCRRVYILFF